MNLKTATKILDRHNKWRRGDEKILMVEAERLGIAIDTILSKLKDHGDIKRSSKCPECKVGDLKAVEFTHYCGECGHPNG